MRQSSRLLLAAAVVAGSLVSPRASAQIDVNPPPPNVLLLVDSSGSMEYKSSSPAFPTCDPTKDNVSEKSRWIELVEVMTGSIKDDKYRCQALDRSSSFFGNEFSLGSVKPADWYYTNPYHRIMHEKCTPGAGVMPSTVFDWPTNAIGFHEYNDLTKNCDFKQNNDGLLDDGAFRKNVRFGLMTFDTLPDAGVGYTGSTANYQSGVDGTWSYFLGSGKQGKPAACSTLQAQEVGARNAAAPPWEGRMMAFGPPSNVPDTSNDRIQEVLLATRPFGATPVAGMLDDARDFLWNDTTVDPVNGGDFGPKNDPYIAGGCRNNFVVLLSDGEPNMELRPHCEGAGPPAGVCPYDKPEDIAYDLANAADPKRKTPVFVIGFAVSNVTLASSATVDCKTLTVNDLTGATGLCAQNPSESQLQACCVLNRIAYNGGTDRAYFANDKDELRSALSAILSGLAASSSSRTVPVFASTPGGAGPAGSAGARVYTSFKPGQFSLWSGILERQRVACETDILTGTTTPVPQPLDKAKGDDFVWNVNSGAGPKRWFWTVVGEKDNGKESERTVRPHIGSTDVDGLGTHGGKAEWSQSAGFAAKIPPEAMEIKKNDCTKGVSDAECRDRIVNWLTGEDTTSDYSRCTSPGSATCSLIGDIYHSTPRIVSRPVEFLRDESYTLYSLQQAKRHTMLYTSTNDGFLHGFKMASGDPATDPNKVDTAENNEMWAFLPPAVLSSIKSMYPPTHQTLNDGFPVVMDVVGIEDPSPPSSGYPYKFERSGPDARAGKGVWRTVLVQSFGGSRGGYFAVDITDPVVPPNPGTDPKKGPQFLWQLTLDKDGDPLFGRSSATPLITTLYFGDPAKEVAVAILPGGDDPDGPEAGKDATRKNDTPPNVDVRFPVRTKVPKYKDEKKNHAGRSITIVRLDTGEVIMRFSSDDDKELKLKDKGRVLKMDIDSPITGTPVAFPGTTGSVSDRVFVGDRDGTLWRLDFANTDPKKWKMNLFFDMYSGLPYDAGQPIQTPPVLSVDLVGNVTVAFSTGDQDVLLGQPGMKNFVVSLTEKLNATGDAYASEVNWFTPFDDGERVTGPMTLFNSTLFFTSYKPEPPSAAAACGAGSSRVWGVDYIVPKTPGASIASLDDGGNDRMPDGGSLVQFLDNTSSMLANAGIIFGVGVSQLPSCTQETSVSDEFLGSGTHTSITNVSPGKFQLVMHVSGQGNVSDNSQTKRVEIDLPTPPSTSRIDSWAAIVE